MPLVVKMTSPRPYMVSGSSACAGHCLNDSVLHFKDATMTSTTAIASYYGIRLDASDAFIQGYVDGMRWDAKGQSTRCGKGWIAAGKTCRAGQKGGKMTKPLGNKSTVLSREKRKTTVKPEDIARQLSPRAQKLPSAQVRGADMVDLAGARQKSQGAASMAPSQQGRATQVNAEKLRRQLSRQPVLGRRSRG